MVASKAKIIDIEDYESATMLTNQKVEFILLPISNVQYKLRNTAHVEHLIGDKCYEYRQHYFN